MEKHSNWKQSFYNMGRAGSIFDYKCHPANGDYFLSYRKTGSAMVLSVASLVGFLPYAVCGQLLAC